MKVLCRNKECLNNKKGRCKAKVIQLDNKGKCKSKCYAWEMMKQKRGVNLE